MTHTTHDPRTCQVCGQRFDTTSEKGVHATLTHNLRRTGATDRTRQFIACQCGQRTYVGMTCTCGLIATPAAWSEITRNPS